MSYMSRSCANYHFLDHSKSTLPLLSATIPKHTSTINTDSVMVNSSIDEQPA